MGRVSMNYDFQERLRFSLGEQQASDHATIKAMLSGCVSVEDASQLLNTAGVDYIARLRKGAEVLIDAKTRSRGCSRYWYNSEPEFALEIWSVRPGGRFRIPEERRKTGWTLCEAKKVDLILFKFHPEDTRQVYLVSFQLLRMAFSRHLAAWRTIYKNDVQASGTWESECLFVPANVAYEAMRKVSLGELRTSNQAELIKS